jgi:hypothetical protein
MKKAMMSLCRSVVFLVFWVIVTLALAHILRHVALWAMVS